MMDLSLKKLWLTIIVLIICSIEQYFTLSICPTAIWQRNAVTVAGMQAGTSGFSSSQLNAPNDVYIDNNNSIYALDRANYRVQRILSNSTTGKTVLYSSYGSGLNQTGFMYDMSVSDNGSMYILDSDNGRVVKWMQESSSGTLVAGGYGVGSNSSQINGAGGMFIDFNTLTIWIADTNNHRIVKWSSPTTSVVVCGSYGSNDTQLSYPGGLFIDTNDSNTLYIADTSNHRISMWLPGATSGKTVAGITNYYGTGLNQLWSPNTLILDNNRNMFIVDTSNNRILKWVVGEISGMIIAGDTVSGTQSNQLFKPININFDSNGSLVVADTYNNRVQKFFISCPSVSDMSTTTASSVTTISASNISSSMITWSYNAMTIAGSPIGVYGSTATALNWPYDIFVDKNNILYVLDTYNYRVQRFFPNSTVGTTVVSGTSGSKLNQFNKMYSISVDVNANIYIADAGNNRVVKWAPGAVNGTIVAGGNGRGSNANQLNYPCGIFMGSNASIIWIADTSNSRIVRWESLTTGIIIGGSYGTQANQFAYPYGIFVDLNASNTIYVADTYNHRIQRWLQGANNGTTVAGQTGICGNGLNQLCFPESVVGDNNGNIYITDYSNNRIMQWTVGSTSGIMVAGSSTYGGLPNQLYSPYSTKLDTTGALIVTDTYNNRIQNFSVSPASSTTSTTTASTTTTTTTLTSTVTSDVSSTITLIVTSTISSIVIQSSAIPNTTMLSTTATVSSSSSMVTSTSPVTIASSSSSMVTSTSPVTIASSSSSMARNTSVTTISASKSTSTMMSTTISKVSLAYNDNCPQRLLIIICSIIILLNN